MLTKELNTRQSTNDLWKFEKIKDIMSSGL